MYKVTVGDKTMVGCNEDAWRLTSRIWYENGAGSGQYGACFTGSRFDGSNGFAPQSGMNEQGLAFSRLASHTPTGSAPELENKKSITNPTLYLKDILHNCKTVEEVQVYIAQYDHRFFQEVCVVRSGLDRMRSDPRPIPSVLVRGPSFCLLGAPLGN